MYKYMGVILVVLALVIAIFPQFADCQSRGKAITLANGNTIPMKCHWTAQAEIAAGIPILAIGAMMIFNRRKETIRSLSLAGIILGILVIMLPTRLIGVCATPTMLCHTTMLPVLTITGGLVTGVSLIAAMVTFKIKEKNIEYAKSRSY